MYQDIEPNVYDNQYLPDAKPDDTSRILSYKGKGGYMSPDGRHMTYAEYKQRGGKEPLRYLFKVNTTSYFLCEEEFPAEPGYELLDNIRDRHDIPKDTMFAQIVGSSLERWYRTRRYCGCCGAKTVHSSRERAVICPECGITEYPKISPVVIVGIINGDKILCSKYKVGYAHWALIAGFSEIGESIEGTVKREVMEETGLKVKNLRYYSCQPWPYSDSMLFGFFCDLDGDDKITIQEDELAVAAWISRDEMPEQKNLFSLTATMMEAFRKGENI